MALEDIVAKLDSAARAARGRALRGEGALTTCWWSAADPAGAAAAIYAARKGIRTGIAAERLGGQLLDTVGIENFISVKETEGHKLAAGLEQHVTHLRRGCDEFAAGRRAACPGESDRSAARRAAASLKARSVVLATGARWREINVPGEREYRNRGVAYCPHCDGPLFKGKRVAVIGGGNSGVEAAIDLAGLVEPRHR